MPLPVNIQQALQNAATSRSNCLSLNSSGITDGDLIELGQVLNNYANLIDIDLTNNNLTIIGLRGFIQSNTTISRLNAYKGNKVYTTNLPELQTLILNHPKLKDFPIQGGSGTTLANFRAAIKAKPPQPPIIVQIPQNIVPIAQPAPPPTTQTTLVQLPVVIPTVLPPPPPVQLVVAQAPIVIPPQTTPGLVATPLTPQQTYLGLPNELFNDPNPNYLISMAPINSSGDIYHIVAYLLLSLLRTNQAPTVQLTYDAQATSEQAQRSLLFVFMLGLQTYFYNPISITENANGTREGARQAGLHRYLEQLPRPIYYVDQKALTTIIANEFIQNRQNTATQLRTAFRQRNAQFFPAAVNQEIQLIITEWLTQIRNTIANKPLIVFHVRYSSAANKQQNFYDDFIGKLKLFLENRGYAVWFIFADSRKTKSFTGIKHQRISPFSDKTLTRVQRHLGYDYGKILHLEILDRLLDLPQMFGVIGNTSGTIDLAAFLGHRVYNIHTFSEGGIAYQDYRILLQTAFFTVEKFFEDFYVGFCNQRDRQFTEEIIRQIIPSFLNWLVNHNNLKPNVIVPGTIDFTLAGFIELCFIKTWRKQNDLRNFNGVLRSHHETTPFISRIPAVDTTNTYIRQPTPPAAVQHPTQALVNPGTTTGMFVPRPVAPTPYLPNLPPVITKTPPTTQVVPTTTRTTQTLLTQGGANPADRRENTHALTA